MIFHSLTLTFPVCVDTSVGASDLFGDADDISDSEGEEATAASHRSSKSPDSDAGDKLARPKQHVISEDEDEEDKRSDRDVRSRSREGSPKQPVRVWCYVFMSW